MNQIREILKMAQFWTKYGLILEVTYENTLARMGKYVKKFIRPNSFHIKNISSKFHRNIMNQIWNILKTAYFGTKYGLMWTEILGMPGKNEKTRYQTH